jgi:hypothetical protein
VEKEGDYIAKVDFLGREKASKLRNQEKGEKM